MERSNTKSKAAEKILSTLEATKLKKIVNKIIPKITPAPWHIFFALLSFVAIPTTLVVLFFSGIGWGTVFVSEETAEREEMAGMIIKFIGLMMMTMYMLDANLWESGCGLAIRRVR